MDDKKYFWLKLKKDFFKRHDIKIIEGMTNGKDYVLFYLKLLCESVDHEGRLRFDEEIPYNEQMLSTITNTNIDIVRSAVKIFTSLKMMDILDDGSYYMNKIEKMIGHETYWAERKRIQKSKIKCTDELDTLEKVQSVQHLSKQELELEIELEKELDKDNNTPKSRNFVKPTLEEVNSYCNERNNGVDPEKWFNFYESKGWMIGKNKMKDWRAAVRTWERGTIKIQKEPVNQDALNYFFKKYEEKVGSKYVLMDKDTDLMNEMLKFLTIDQFKYKVNAFFTTDNDFVRKAGWTIGVFKSQINKIKGDKYEEGIERFIKNE